MHSTLYDERDDETSVAACHVSACAGTVAEGPPPQYNVYLWLGAMRFPPSRVRHE